MLSLRPELERHPNRSLSTEVESPCGQCPHPTATLGLFAGPVTARLTREPPESAGKRDVQRLSESFGNVYRKLSGKGSISESNVQERWRMCGLR